MNKWLWIAILILMGWVGKLSFDIYQINNKNLISLNLALDQQNQRVGNLNDEMVALQQQIVSQKNNVGQVVTGSDKSIPDSSYQAGDYIEDHLQLVQLALDQQQFNVALQHLQDIRESINNNQLFSESMTAALLQSLAADQARIILFLQQRAEHIQIVQQNLKILNQQFKPTALTANEDKWDLSQWFSIREETRQPQLGERNLHYKQIQLQLLLAQQALMAGQFDFYREQIADIVLQISIYPDKFAEQNLKQLNQLQNITLSPLAPLSTLALMREHQ